MATSYNTRLGNAPEEGIKAPVKVVSASNLTLSGEQTINSVAVVANDRVLVNAQSDSTENGIYVVSTGAWSRAKDFNSANDVVNGVLVLDVNSSGLYRAVFSGSWTPGTTSISFSVQSTATVQHETQLGSAAVANKFTLAGMTYKLGIDNIWVLRNGQMIFSNSPSPDYTETSENEVTLTYSPNANDRYDFFANLTTTSNVSNAGAITYTPSGAGAVATNVQSKLRELPSFGDYSPDTTGATDVSALLQTALDEQDSLYIPPGTYKLSSTVYVKGRGKQFIGAGQADTIFSVDAGIQGIVIGNDATSTETNHEMNVGQFSVSGGTDGIQLGGNGAGPKAFLGELHNVRVSGATTAGLRLMSPQGAEIVNCNFRDNAKGVVSDAAQATTATTFKRCRIYNNTGDGVYMQTGEGISFIACNIEQNGGWGVNLEKNVGVALSLITFTGCWFESNTSGSVISDDGAIADIQFHYCNFNITSGTYHLDLTLDSFTLVGNRFLSPTASAVICRSVNASYLAWNSTGADAALASIPSTRNGMLLDNSGQVTCKDIDLSPGQGVNGVNLTTGNLNISDGQVKVTQTTDSDDGDLVSSFSAAGSLVAPVRLNCGGDVDRVGLKFTVNGVISSYLWVDDTGQPRWKTSLPANDTDGTAM